MTTPERATTAAGEEARILEFVNGSLRPADEPVTDPELDLIAAGVIDSVGILELVVFLEDAFGLSVAQDQLSPENFGTVSAIAHLVRSAR